MPLLTTFATASAEGLGFGAASGKPAAMTAIASTTVSGTTTGTITFSSIPSTYDDLLVVCFRQNGSVSWRLNNDTSSIYSSAMVQAAGAAESYYTANGNNFSYGGDNGDTTTPGNIIMHYLNYSSTNGFKLMLLRSSTDLGGTTSGRSTIVYGMYRSTTAINRIDITASNFTAGSVFALYGIKKA